MYELGVLSILVSKQLLVHKQQVEFQVNAIMIIINY
jgi:hypothetical protein